MAHEHLALANVCMLRRVTSRKARREGPTNMQSQMAGPFLFFEGRLVSPAQNACIQASDRALIMVSKERNFG